jgi:hypothetical protein
MENATSSPLRSNNPFRQSSQSLPHSHSRPPSVSYSSFDGEVDSALEEEEVGIKMRLVQLQRLQLRFEISEVETLEEEEFRARLRLVQVKKNPNGAENREDEALELEELTLRIRQLELRRHRLIKERRSSLLSEAGPGTVQVLYLQAHNRGKSSRLRRPRSGTLML